MNLFFLQLRSRPLAGGTSQCRDWKFRMAHGWGCLGKDWGLTTTRTWTMKSWLVYRDRYDGFWNSPYIYIYILYYVYIYIYLGSLWSLISGFWSLHLVKDEEFSFDAKLNDLFCFVISKRHETHNCSLQQSIKKDGFGWNLPLLLLMAKKSQTPTKDEVVYPIISRLLTIPGGKPHHPRMMKNSHYLGWLKSHHPRWVGMGLWLGTYTWRMIIPLRIGLWDPFHSWPIFMAYIYMGVNS